MEQTQGRGAVVVDKNKVLDIKPLRCLVPIFPSQPNFSLFTPPQGMNPFGNGPPAGLFPPGAAPFFPQFTSPESQTRSSGAAFNTPISNAVPVNSFKTPSAPNGSAGSSRRKSGVKSQFADSDGYGDSPHQSSPNVSSFSTHVNDADHTSRTGKRRGRGRPRKDRNGHESNDADVDAIVNSLITAFHLAIDSSHLSDGDKGSVECVLNFYDLLRRKITQIDESKDATEGGSRQPNLRAGTILMQNGIRTNIKKRIGAVPGIEVGDIFFFRMELCLAGLHAPSMAGIDYMGVKLSQEEEPLAVSIVSSGGYEDNMEHGDVLIYTGQGGNVYYKDKKLTDQKLERGNLALDKSSHQGNEVRVIRGVKDPSSASGKIYIYDGLYKIQESWIDKGTSGFNVFRYKLVRLPGQPQAFTMWQSIQLWKDGLATRTGTILPDLTSGAESVPVALVNEVDDDKGPAYFTYIPNLKYSKLVRSIEPSTTCNCTRGCRPGNHSCACIQKNEGHLPYNANGTLVSKKSMVYECGPSCQCPPNCRNRVSQSGLRVRLEVFRTKDKGWGLRSWDSIRAGAYICEYAGEVLDISKIEELGVNREDNYIFDATRIYQPLEFLPAEFNEDPRIPFPLFISAKHAGNVARFMNHSCSPNVFWQPILRGNRNDCDIHIAFHAIRHIPPMVELTYDYGVVQSDIAGQLKKKCLCGSVKCRGYFY